MTSWPYSDEHQLQHLERVGVVVGDEDAARARRRAAAAGWRPANGCGVGCGRQA